MLKPFAWYGGKSLLAPTLVSLLPTHQTYCEVFGGSGALLFAKSPSQLEIFNDLDSGVVNFFHVLRDAKQVERLVNLLSLTPYAYEEYYDCLAKWEDESDPIERARQWYVGVMQSMNSSIKNTGWSHTKLAASNPAHSWLSNTTHFTAFTERLAHIEVDHRDFERVIASYDSPDTCFYLDPPYHPDTRRKGRCYQYEMTEADHERLLFCILQVQGMVILSGYSHPTYERALREWECIKIDQKCSSSVRPGVGEAPAEWRRIEYIWRNPACVRQARKIEQQSLFDDSERVLDTNEEVAS